MQDDATVSGSDAEIEQDDSVVAGGNHWWQRVRGVMSKPVAWMLAAFFAALGAAVAAWVNDLVLNWDYRLDVELNVDRIQPQLQQGGGEYLIDYPAAEIGPPPNGTNSCNGRYEWAHENGAVDVSTTLVRVSVAAQEGHQVQLIGARPVPVGARNEPAVGSVLTCPGRGGPLVRYLHVDLDTADAVFFDGESDEPQEINLPVAGGTTEVIDIVAHTAEAYWSYRIELVFVVDGVRHVEVIDDDGAAFQTTSPMNARSYQWIDGRWQDVTAGSSSPAPELSVEIPNACSLISVREASDVMGVDLEPDTDIGPQVSFGPSGHAIAVTLCLYISPTGESLQVSITRTASDKEAAEEFDEQLALIDPSGVGRDLPGISDAKLVMDGQLARVLALRGATIFDISAFGSGGPEEFDVDRLTELLEIARQRTQLASQ